MVDRIRWDYKYFLFTDNYLLLLIIVCNLYEMVDRIRWDYNFFYYYFFFCSSWTSLPTISSPSCKNPAISARTSKFQTATSALKFAPSLTAARTSCARCCAPWAQKWLLLLNPTAQNKPLLKTINRDLLEMKKK